MILNLSIVSIYNYWFVFYLKYLINWLNWLIFILVVCMNINCIFIRFNTLQTYIIQ